MGTAIITGVFALLLAGLSWVLTNGSRRTRLLARIERESKVLTELAQDQPGRDDLSQVLATDLKQLREWPARALGRTRGVSPWWALFFAVLSVLTAVVSALFALKGTYTEIRILQ